MEYRFSTPGSKIAAFDMDHTLLKAKDGRKFSRGRDDALLVYDCIPEKLDALRKDGYKIILFTNQKKKKKADVPVEDIYAKVDRLLGDDIDIFISYQNDYYRKPSLGMYDAFLDMNGPFTEMFYVGDAAGRKNDFSTSDLLFAHNMGIPFYTPEKFFLNEEGFPPVTIALTPPTPVTVDLKDMPVKAVIIMIGPPGSGKSHMAQELEIKLPGCIRFSNDQTGSGQKTLKHCQRELKKGRPYVVIDNTNPSVASREPFLRTAQEAKYPAIAMINRLPENYAKHLNKLRAYRNKTKCIPDLVYRIFNKKFQEPSKKEGFIQVIEFVPDLPEEVFRYIF